MGVLAWIGVGLCVLFFLGLICWFCCGSGGGDKSGC